MVDGKEVKKENINLRVTNIVFSGKLPIKNINLKDVIEHSYFRWNLINEETSPILQTRFYTDGKTKKGRKPCICVSIWKTGAINIVGCTKLSEGKKYYNLILNEITHIISCLPKVKELS